MYDSTLDEMSKIYEIPSIFSSIASEVEKDCLVGCVEVDQEEAVIEEDE